jgi:hypothetical protein
VVSRNFVAQNRDVRPDYATESHAKAPTLWRMRLRSLFTEHPASVGETYFQHLRAAAGFSATMMLGGMACLLHAIFPFAFRKTGSECISQLHERMVSHRNSSAARVSRAGALR